MLIIEETALQSIFYLAEYSANFLYILSLFSLIGVTWCSTAEINRHLEMGRQFLSKMQLADALSHYHAAIERDPDNYHTLYLRATVYLAMGKSNAAILDLDQVLQLKPDFDAARAERGNVLLKQGDLDSAARDYKSALTSDPENQDYALKISVINDVKKLIEAADSYFDISDFSSAEKYYTSCIEVCLWNVRLYKRRAQCYINLGVAVKAMNDYRTVSKLSPTETEPFFVLSTLHYEIGDPEESLVQIRGCLKLNPDHQACFAHYKHVKKLTKLREDLNEKISSNKWMDCLETAEKILKFERKIQRIELDVFKSTCKCNVKLGHAAEAVSVCTQVLKEGDRNDLDALCDRAEAYLLLEQYDDAIEDYRSAAQAHDDSRRAKEGLNKAQKLKKQAGKKDYYKILNVRRNADKQEIVKAYRKLARKYHPDNFLDENEKKKAETKFLEIAAAKEVLTDPEKKARFDQGEDPLDPEQQQGGFQHPFNEGFGGFPFSGEGFSFKFNFG